MKGCANKPCPTCPWRKSSLVGGGDIPNFDIELMRNLKNTVPERGSSTSGFHQIMACHESTGKKMFACAGYVVQVGIDLNTNVRLMPHTFGTDLGKVIENSEGIDMYDDFYTMLDDYEEAQ